MNTTDRYRLFSWFLWTVCVLVAFGGWMFFGRDPSQLAPVLGWITAGPLISEASNVGKRATWKQEAAEMEVVAEAKEEADEAESGGEP